MNPVSLKLVTHTCISVWVHCTCMCVCCGRIGEHAPAVLSDLNKEMAINLNNKANLVKETNCKHMQTHTHIPVNIYTSICIQDCNKYV